jgi:Domain of unknown function (DUF389)
VITFVAVLVLRETGIGPQSIASTQRPLTQFISHPDFFSFVVAFLAGTAGMLSLSAAKSGALIGVLISVTTIPAAGNIGAAAAYGNWGESSGAAIQLALNLSSIVAAGVLTLSIQRWFYLRRRSRHHTDSARARAGLPVARTRFVDGPPRPRARSGGGGAVPPRH